MSAKRFVSSPKWAAFLLPVSGHVAPRAAFAPEVGSFPKERKSPKQGQTWGDSKTAHNEKNRLHSGSGGGVPGDAYQRRPRAKALSMAGSSTVRILELRPSFRYALQIPW